MADDYIGPGVMSVATLYNSLAGMGLIKGLDAAGFREEIQKLGKRVIDVLSEGVTTRTVSSVSLTDARAIYEHYKAEKAKRESSSGERAGSSALEKV